MNRVTSWLPSAPASTTALRASCRRSRPGATVVHLDIDAAEISKLRRADVPVVGPLKHVHGDLTAQLRVKARPRRGPGCGQLEAWREEFPLRYGSGELLKPQRVSRHFSG